MLDLSNEQFCLRTPAQRFIQGGRYVYSFPLELENLHSLLPERVNENVAYEANRRLTPSHAKTIQDYLESQQKWVLGTILLGIDEKEVEFIPYPGQLENVPVVSGELRLRHNPKETMKLFDGQHRRLAIGEAFATLSTNDRRRDKLEQLRGESVPVMLYSECDIPALQQMFADASKTKPVERNAVAQFDMRDAFNLAANDLLAFSDFLKDRVELNRSSVVRTSHCIITINQLSQALRAIEVGIDGRVNKEKNGEYLLEIDNLVNRCWTWSDEFLPAARKEYDRLLSDQIDNSEIPEWRNKSMAFNATVFRVLAGCYYAWMKDESDWRPLADFLRRANFEPGTGPGALLVDAELVLPGGNSPIGRMRQIKAGVDYIVSSARTWANSG